MINKIRLLLLIPVTTVFFLSILLSCDCAAEEDTNFEPLFPIDLKHDFPQSEEVFEEVKELILNNYYSDEITENILYWAAIKGMLRHISPPSNPDLAKIWTPDEYEIVENTLHGEQISIGIKSSYNAREGSLTISEVLPGSPAEGLLKPLDRILRVNSQSLKNRSVNDVNNLLKGEEGEEITLTINRDIDIFDLKITCRKFDTQNLIITELTDRMLLVEIKKLTLDISKELKEELSEYRDGIVRGIIIDLRSNTGGILSEALKIIELFLPEKHILLRTVQRETGLQNYVSANKEPFYFNMAILVNKKTASSAEILASALQDHQKALIVGTGTYGKAVFDKTFTLKNDYHVKFITGAMYSPRGKSWQGKGIVPDFLVEQNDDTLNTLMKLEPKKRFQKDVAMITAYKLLNRD